MRVSVRSPGRILVALLAGAVVATTVRAQVPPETPLPTVSASRQNERYVIPAGAEPLFAAMLGSGETLPGDCKFSDGQIERTTVLATYTCPGGKVVFGLHHPEEAPPGGVRTSHFAVVVKSGAPPQALTDAVVARIRAHEGDFTWKVLGETPASLLRRAFPFAAGLLVALLLIWAVGRYGARRSSSGGSG